MRLHTVRLFLTFLVNIQSTESGQLIIMKYLTVVLLSFLLFTSCNVLNSSSRKIITNLNIESSGINRFQDLEATFSVKNDTKNKVVYNFSSGCQTGFKILHSNKVVYNSTNVVGCIAVLTELKLNKNQKKTFTISNHPDLDLQQGSYTLKMFLIGYENEVSATKEFVVK